MNDKDKLQLLHGILAYQALNNGGSFVLKAPFCDLEMNAKISIIETEVGLELTVLTESVTELTKITH